VPATPHANQNPDDNPLSSVVTGLLGGLGSIVSGLGKGLGATLDGTLGALLGQGGKDSKSGPLGSVVDGLVGGLGGIVTGLGNGLGTTLDGTLGPLIGSSNTNKPAASPKPTPTSEWQDWQTSNSPYGGPGWYRNNPDAVSDGIEGPVGTATFSRRSPVPWPQLTGLLGGLLGGLGNVVGGVSDGLGHTLDGVLTPLLGSNNPPPPPPPPLPGSQKSRGSYPTQPDPFWLSPPPPPFPNNGGPSGQRTISSYTVRGTQTARPTVTVIGQPRGPVQTGQPQNFPPQQGYSPQQGYPPQPGYPPQQGYPPQPGYQSQTYPPPQGYPPQNFEPQNGGRRASMSVMTSGNAVYCRRYPDSISANQARLPMYSTPTRLDVQCWTQPSLQGNSGRMNGEPIWLQTLDGCFINKREVRERDDFQAILNQCPPTNHWVGMLQSQYSRADCYDCPSLDCPSQNVGEPPYVDLACHLEGEAVRSNR
jgi:hypothetical protein